MSLPMYHRQKGNQKTQVLKTRVMCFMKGVDIIIPCNDFTMNHKDGKNSINLSLSLDDSFLDNYSVSDILKINNIIAEVGKYCESFDVSVTEYVYNSIC